MNGPFKVFQKVGDNTYRLELPEEYGVSPIFNVVDLAPYVHDDSRASPFQPRKNGVNASPDQQQIEQIEALVKLADEGGVDYKAALGPSWHCVYCAYY